MLYLQWTDDARDDLIEILDYIEKRNPAAARRLQADIVRVAETLPTNPYLYRAGRVPGTREAVVWPHYIIVYLAGRTSIEILRVLHAAREYPSR